MALNATQSHLGFLVSQIAHIERQVYDEQYPEIQYPELIPVSTEAPAWARTITHYSRGFTGEPERLASRANDVPLVAIQRQKYDLTIETDTIGYDYTLEEVNQAMLIPGMNLTAELASAARRSAEKKLDVYAMYGDADLDWPGLLNADTRGGTGVVARNVAEGAAGVDAAAKRLWANKTTEEILRDINDLLLGVYIDSHTVLIADTLCVPPNTWSDLTSKFVNHTNETVLTTIRKNNVYTAKRGMYLMIREVRGLENAGAGQTGRMMAYRRDPSVLRYHIPMPLQFLEPLREPFRWLIPGIYRTAGVDIRLPANIRYGDGITT